jgi:co-chaperonin GroES (HSP10)
MHSIFAVTHTHSFAPLPLVQVKPGDRILYFKYAGDNMETPSGEKYVVLREDDILCKA